jgi:hypothetical protein
LLTMVREADLKPASSVMNDTPHVLVSLPLRGRSRASYAPTASGQNQRLRGQASNGTRLIRQIAATSLLPAGRRSPACRRWCAKRTSNLTTRWRLTHHMGWFHCRCAADREQATLLRPPARIKSFAGKPRSNGTRSIHQIAANSLLPAGRRSPACRRWCAKRTSNLETRSRLTHRVGWFHCRCAADREQATLLRPPARIKGFAGKLRSYGLRPESKASRASLAPTERD